MEKDQTAVFDLDALDPKAACNEGSWVQVRLDNEPIGLEIKVQGRFSDTYERIQQAEQRKATAEFKRTQKFPIDDPVDQAEKKVNTCVQCTTDWRGPSAKGEFSKDKIRALYEKHKWILEQVDRAIGEDARFLKR